MRIVRAWHAALQEAAWLEQQEALLAAQAAMPVAPIYTRKPAKKARTPELDDAESQQYSPYPRFSRCAAGPYSSAAKAPFWV